VTFRRPVPDVSADTWLAYASLLAVVTVVHKLIEGSVGVALQINRRDPDLRGRVIYFLGG
jgi:hypothetical protein